MIGLLGGTFDPIHFGHLRPALEVAETCALDELRFIPSATPPHRWQPLASAEHRRRMVELAISETSRFVLDDREYRRQGPSYTVDTLRSIRAEYAAEESLVLLMGLDAFQSFESWRQWRTILTLSHLIVTTRPGYHTEQKVPSWLEAHQAGSVDELEASASGRILFLPVTRLEISATRIRELVQQGSDIRYLVPNSVNDYIREHRLYT